MLERPVQLLYAHRCIAKSWFNGPDLEGELLPPMKLAFSPQSVVECEATLSETDHLDEYV